MFPCVWLHFKKFSKKYFLVFGKEEGKHKSRKIQATTQKKIINDRDPRSIAPARSRLIAIQDRDLAGAISRRRDRDQRRDLAVDASRDRAVDRDQRRGQDRDRRVARSRRRS